MGSLQTRVQRARQLIALAAEKRWRERTARREASLNAVRTQGPGAGDTPERQQQFAAREQARFFERRIGTWDATLFAPSELARAIGRPVARLVTLPGEGLQPEGFATGFLVSPRLLLTNHHVFPDPSTARGMGANFLYQSTDQGTSLGVTFALDPEAFYLSDPAFDFALVAVEPRARTGEPLTDFSPIPLIASTGKILVGDPINIIQHPNGGPRQYAITNNRLLDVLEEGFIHYETDTQVGSSGSPAFNRSWELVGLHHCGIPAMRDGRALKTDGTFWDAGSDSENDIDWVANEGTRVSKIVSSLKTHPATGAVREHLDELFQLTVDRLQPLPDSTGTPMTPPNLGATTAAAIFNISGPTTIYVAGEGGATVLTKPLGTTVTPAKPAVLEKKLLFDSDYSHRLGYRPDFLGTVIPLPTVVTARRRELYAVADYEAYRQTSRLVPVLNLTGLRTADAVLLNYHHYTIAFNKTYRMAMWTACNVDYRPVMRRDTRPRKDFGGEDWTLDPRVPPALQLVDKDIYEPAHNLDRGHLVRREDSAWGTPGIATEYANADTYHWTNCTPQHELFNQETPAGPEYVGRRGIWGAFENELSTQITAGGGQMTLFSGPVLNPTLLRKKDFGKGDVFYPLKFWKVVIIAENAGHTPKLFAYGLLFDQEPALKEFGLGFEEQLDLTKFPRIQIRLTDLSKLTGIEFPTVVLQADTFRPKPGARTSEAIIST